jgi:hypothetical protein
LKTQHKEIDTNQDCEVALLRAKRENLLSPTREVYEKNYVQA